MPAQLQDRGESAGVGFTGETYIGLLAVHRRAPLELDEGVPVEFRVLGPVEADADGRLVDAGRPQQRLVLAILLADAGRPVSTETLIDRVWDTAPDGARRTLHVYVARLRRLLAQSGSAAAGSAPLVRRSGGYLLDVDPDLVDIHRFHRLVAASREPLLAQADRVARLREATGLWRGEPLSGLGGRWAARTRAAWQQEHVNAVALWAQAEHLVGNSAAVIGPLTELAGQYPFAEPLVLELMRALLAVGRGADALELYAHVRRQLADELGIDPGRDLQRLYQAILYGGSQPPGTIQVATRAGPVPAQLPADVRGFTGRTGHLAELDNLLSAGDPQTSVVLSALSGTAGVGKTALAVHWAHQVKDRFPDGQLYVNLRGFDPTGSPVTPAEALRGFLEAFEVPAYRMPKSVDAQAALYRSLLVGRRMLVILDNARDAEQVRPLLPGSPTCLAVVTSRRQLSGLIVTEGAQPVMVDLPGAAEARQMLVHRLGAARIAAEPPAVDEIVERCARLPLALAVVAARAAAYPGFPLATFAIELRQARSRLDALAGGDPAMDVRAVFSWSYHCLTGGAARLFRLLGLHPGPDVGTVAAASLAGLPLGRARVLLTELARAHLVVEPTPGRFTFHDLLRAYAADLAEAVDEEAERHAALLRVLDHYLHTAHTADHMINPHRDPIALPPLRPGAMVARLDDPEQARAWLATEQTVLLAAIRQAADAGLHTHAWHLAWVLTDFFDRCGHRDVWTVLCLTSARTAGTPDVPGGPARAYNHRILGHAYFRLDQFDDAFAHLRHALDLFAELGDDAGQAHSHLGLAWLFGRQADYRQALHHATQALQQARVSGHRGRQANALNAVGWYHAQLGDHRQALHYCEQALTMFVELGDRYAEADTRDSIGYARHHLGHHHQAITYYQQAIKLYAELGDRYNHANTVIRLGDTYDAVGDGRAARAHWRGALDILTELDHPDADTLQSKLDSEGLAAVR
jgi:DNA-binding SARP family transcriptional activator/tetratricopeptide (TPR) repeat protein